MGPQYDVIRTANFRRSGVATIQSSKSLLRFRPAATTAASSSAPIPSDGIGSEDRDWTTVYDYRKAGVLLPAEPVSRRQRLPSPPSGGKVMWLPILPNNVSLRSAPVRVRYLPRTVAERFCAATPTRSRPRSHTQIPRNRLKTRSRGTAMLPSRQRSCYGHAGWTKRRLSPGPS